MNFEESSPQLDSEAPQLDSESRELWLLREFFSLFWANFLFSCRGKKVRLKKSRNNTIRPTAARPSRSICLMCILGLGFRQEFLVCQKEDNFVRIPMVF